MGVIQKIQNRQKYPVKLGDGDNAETAFVRTLSLADAQKIEGIADGAEKLFFAVGQSLLEDDGQPAFQMKPEETPSQFAHRVREELAGMGQDTLLKLSEAISKVTKPPKMDTVVKN